MVNYIVLLYLIISVGPKRVPIIQLLFHVHHYRHKELIQAVRISRIFSIKNMYFCLIYLEFITRHCLPTGNWSSVSFQPCVYPDIWELMMTFYIQRTTQQRKVCLYMILILNKEYLDILFCTYLVLHIYS